MEDLISLLVARFGEVVSEPKEFRGETTIDLSDPSLVEKVCQCLKKELGFNYLVDISSVDHYGDDPRFCIVYEIRNLDKGYNLRLRTSVSEEGCELPTVSTVWSTADWHEREIYDMMGVRFNGHPDLKRILMWEGYPHFPLRKDFPLAGKPTDLPEVAFTGTAPLEGGPFVTSPTDKTSVHREPRARGNN